MLKQRDRGDLVPRFDFQIAEASAEGWITGRNCRADAPVGLTFTAVYRRDFPEARPGDDMVSPDFVFVCKVSLRLDAVELYGRNMDSVDHGYTALLNVSGSGMQMVSELVSTAPAHTYYSLCAFDD